MVTKYSNTLKNTSSQQVLIDLEDQNIKNIQFFQQFLIKTQEKSRSAFEELEGLHNNI